MDTKSLVIGILIGMLILMTMGMTSGKGEIGRYQFLVTDEKTSSEFNIYMGDTLTGDLYVRQIHPTDGTSWNKYFGLKK